MITLEDNIRQYTVDSYCGSPNNVKGIYLSPYGAIVTYHINYKGNGLLKEIPFKPNNWDRHTNISEVVVNPVLSSLEELVILPMGMPAFASVVFDPKVLVKGYAGGGNLTPMVKQRYKRLKGVFMVEGISIRQVEVMLKSHNYTSIYKMVPRENIRDSVMLRGDDYWKDYGSAGQYYALDKEGSPLNNYFKQVKLEHEATKKAIQEKESSKDKEELYTSYRKKYNHQVIRLGKQTYPQFHIDENKVGTYFESKKASDFNGNKTEMKGEYKKMHSNVLDLLRIASEGIESAVGDKNIKQAYRLACERQGIVLFNPSEKIMSQLKNGDKVNLDLLARYVNFMSEPEDKEVSEE